MNADTASPLRRGAELARLTGISVAAAGAALAAGYGPMRAGWGAAAAPAMLAATLLTLTAALVGLTVTLWSLGSADARQRVNGTLAGVATRFLGTLLLAGAALLSGRFQPAALIVWVGVTYLVLLAVDTLVLVRLLRRCPPGRAGGPDLPAEAGG